MMRTIRLKHIPFIAAFAIMALSITSCTPEEIDDNPPKGGSGGVGFTFDTIVNQDTIELK